ncbi:putative ribonuclease H protein [Vitis vinifera]|uniref:Putative ribonuclease H protein n=1 Tax=Vitis vinifera TaxID=29760 RepID=A0A438E935_VITVI|nr:putative ribonuclease H protein [Vitis vinifera]
MPCYFLSLFKIPASVAAKIERLQRDFLWSGIGEGKRDHLVSWDVVCNPKAKGGLGFGMISLRNLTLLGKWLWRWSHHCPWKAIAQVFQEFSMFTVRLEFSSPFQSEVLCLVSGTQEAWGISRSSFPTLLFDNGVVAQIISVSQDGLGPPEEHL